MKFENERLVLAALILIAVVLRVLWLASMPMPPVENDAVGYDNAARLLLERNVFSFGTDPDTEARVSPNAYTMPGYPLLVSASYLVSGTGESRFQGVRVLQAALTLLLVPLAYFAGRLLSGKRAALLAAIVVVVYPPFTIVSGWILTEALFVVLVAGSLVALLYAYEDASGKGRWLWALAGVLAGMSTLVRAVGLFWIAFMALVVLSRLDRRSMRGVVVLGLAAVLTMAPWWVRNAVVFHRFVPFSTNYANPVLVGTYDAKGERVDQRTFWGQADNDADLNRYHQQMAARRLFDEFREEPAAFVGRRVSETVRKAGMVYGYASGEGILFQFGRLTHKLIVVIGFLALPLALWRRDRRLLLVAATPVFFLGFHSLLLIDARYYFPMMFALAVAASLVLAEVWKRFEARGSVVATAVEGLSTDTVLGHDRVALSADE